MATLIIVLFVFILTDYCAKNFDGMGTENRGNGILKELKLMYSFDSEGYNEEGYDKYGYNKMNINEFGYNKLTKK